MKQAFFIFFLIKKYLNSLKIFKNFNVNIFVLVFTIILQYSLTNKVKMSSSKVICYFAV